MGKVIGQLGSKTRFMSLDCMVMKLCLLRMKESTVLWNIQTVGLCIFSFVNRGNVYQQNSWQVIVYWNHQFLAG